MSQVVSSISKLGYEHYVCFPDDGRRHEIIDGDHYVNAAPSMDHQRFSRKIQYQLYDQIEQTGRGEVINAPADVQLTEHDIVQPDLIIVMQENRLVITPTKIKGTPDMIVEILSPSTRQNDCVLKKELYERVGVPEYWIVNADEHTVDQFVLRDGRYALEGSHASRIDVSTITNVHVDLTKVW
jgi:Uma2 family endonuclease